MMTRFATLCILILVIAFAGVVSCNQEYESSTCSLNRVTQNRSTFAVMDSLILVYDADSSRDYLHSYKNYTPATAELTAAIDSKDSSAFVRLSVSCERTSDEPLSFKLEFEICTLKEVRSYYDCDYRNVFYLDFYGCADKYCLTTQKIILRDENYSYTEVLLPDSDFVIKARSDSDFEQNDFGEDCVVTRNRIFNLQLHTPRIRADWDIQMGSETCQELIPNAMFAETSL